MLHTYIQSARPRMCGRRFAKRQLRAELSYGTGVSLYFQCQTQLVLLSVRDLTRQELQWRELPALASAFSLPLFSFSFLWLQQQILLEAASSLLSDSIASMYLLVCLMHLRGSHRFRQPTRLLGPISSKPLKVHHPMLMHLSFFYNYNVYSSPLLNSTLCAAKKKCSFRRFRWEKSAQMNSVMAGYHRKLK